MVQSHLGDAQVKIFDDILPEPVFATVAAGVELMRAYAPDALPPELAARLADAIRLRPTADWLAVLESANVPGGPVRTIPEAFAHAPYAVVEHAHPKLGTVRTVRSPIGLDGSYPTAVSAPQIFGPSETVNGLQTSVLRFRPDSQETRSGSHPRLPSIG